MSTSNAMIELQRMALETLRELGPSTLGELARKPGLTESTERDELEAPLTVLQVGGRVGTDRTGAGVTLYSAEA